MAGGIHQGLKRRYHHQADAVFQGRAGGLETLHAVVKGPHFRQVFLAENGAHGLGFLAHFAPCLAARFDQRVQFLGALAEQFHGGGVALRGVFDLPQGVDGVPEDVLAAAQVSVKVADGNAQVGKFFLCRLISVRCLVYHVQHLGHAARDGVHAGVYEVAGVAPFLQPLGADAGLHGQGGHVVRVGTRTLRKFKAGFDGRASGGSHGGQGGTGSLEAAYHSAACHVAHLLQRVFQLAVFAGCFLGLAALLVHGVPGVLAAVCQVVRFVGGAFQHLLRFLEGHVGGVGFVAYQFLGFRQGLQPALGGVNLRLGAVHLRGGPVQGDAQLVGLLAVVAVLCFGLFQLGGNQLHLLALRVIDGPQFGQLVLHPGHGCGLGPEGALAGFHVRV